VKRRKHTLDHMVRKQRGRLIGCWPRTKAFEIVKHLEISEQTYQRWRKQYNASRPTTRGVSRS